MFFFHVKKIEPALGIATVYRTLQLLYEQGLIDKFEFGEGKARYELRKNDASGHHHHLVCRQCGKIVDYSEFLDREKKLITDLETALSKKHGFNIDSHQLNFYGLCGKCKK